MKIPSTINLSESDNCYDPLNALPINLETLEHWSKLSKEGSTITLTSFLDSNIRYLKNK